MNAGGMSIKRTRKASAPMGLIILLLALVSLIGLLSGMLTHTLIARHGIIAQVPSTQSPGVSSGATNTPAGSATSGTSTASALASRFQLSISVSSKTVSPGDQVTITVHAYTPDTHAPVSGLSCTLRAPTDGSSALLSTWPDPQTTDANGVATWTVTVPTLAAGSYEVEAYARTPKPWSWKADSTVTVRAS